MLTRAGDFEEWQLAEQIKAGPYIRIYARGNVAYVPYFDLPSGEKKFVKFIKLGLGEKDVWVYVDNSQDGQLGM